MSIEELIDQEVMSHLAHHGWIKNMDPYAIYMLKTSEHPILRFRRTWMRQEALRQVREAECQQKKMDEALEREPWRKRASIRREAVMAPYFAQQMPRMHKTSWSDKDFTNSVRRDSPKVFPKREAF